jgi:ribosome-associated protein
MQVEEIRDTAIAALEEIKARDIVAMDVTKLTSLFDYMIVASGDSTRQTKALARNVQDKLKAAGGAILGIEGEQSGEWVLVDLGAVVVHVMQPAIRDYYNLEQLWGGPPRRASAARRQGEPWADPAAEARP